jgi:hypothetical protein
VSGLLTDPGQVDTWLVQVPALGAVSIALTNLAVDYDLHVNRRDGALIVHSQNPGTQDDVIKISEATPGEYFVYVNSPWGEVSETPYTLMAHFVAGTPQEIASTSPSPILYEADWSQSLRGWSTYYHQSRVPRVSGSGRDWQVSDGMLMNTGDAGCYCWSVLVAPYEPPTRQYVVETVIQVLSEGDSRGIIVRAGSGGHYKVGSDRGYGGMVSDFDNTPLGRRNFRHDGTWHTYRAEVGGGRIRLLIDGVPWVEVPDDRYQFGTGVGLWNGGGGRILVRRFTVLSLP